MQQELLILANDNKDYSLLADEIYKLRDEKELLIAKNAGFASQKQRMSEMVKSLKLQKNIVVYEDKLVVVFKFGMQIEVES